MRLYSYKTCNDSYGKRFVIPFFHTSFGLWRDQYVQNLSATGMAAYNICTYHNVFKIVQSMKLRTYLRK
jgi:hypothetical protein